VTDMTEGGSIWIVLTYRVWYSGGGALPCLAFRNSILIVVCHLRESLGALLHMKPHPLGKIML
jgi:hypothetical protein